jgi:hypothetical protein
VAVAVVAAVAAAWLYRPSRFLIRCLTFDALCRYGAAPRFPQFFGLKLPQQEEVAKRLVKIVGEGSFVFGSGPAMELTEAHGHENGVKKRKRGR